MRYKELQTILLEKWTNLLTERTLFHGTVIDNKDSIEKDGLVPQVGDFVKSSYGPEIDFEDPDWFDQHGEFDSSDDYYSVVFAGDKAGLLSAVGAMRHNIGKKLGKWLGRVTIDDIKKYGMLVIIMSDERFKQHPKDYRKQDQNTPPQVEPLDYWTRDWISPKEIRRILTGDALLRYLNKFGALRTFEDDNGIKAKQTFLFKLVKQYHPEKTIDDIKQKILSIKDPETLDKWIADYQNKTGVHNFYEFN